MADIETTWTSATRKGRGTKFLMNLVPLEFSDNQGLYSDSMLKFNVGFAARWVCEKRWIGSNIEGAIWLGIVLVEGQLRERIEDAAGPRLSKAEIEACVRDCYELIIAFIRGIDEHQDRLGIQPRIYEVSPSKFSTFSYQSVEVSPDKVAASGAVQVL